MKMIRWQGLIAFIAISGLIFGAWIFLIDDIIERSIEFAGTKAVGAKVDLGKADLSISPLGLTLEGLEVTDPDEPMKNMVEVARTAFLVDFAHLLHGKVIVDEMTLDGVRSGTERKRSGALPGGKKKAAAVKKEAVSGEAFSFPSLEVPDPKEILAREELETLKLVDSIRADIENGKLQWKERIDGLPDSDKTKEYKARFKEAKKGLKGGVMGILGGAGELKALKADIKKDVDSIKTARKDLQTEVENLKSRVARIKTMPKEDLRRLQEKYSLSPGGLSSFSRMLFGGKIAEWTDTAFVWYEKTRPVIAKAMEEKPADVKEQKPERGKGINVRFRELRPMPDYLVKVARVSADITAGNIRGEIKEISSDQTVRKTPATFNFTGDKLDGIRSVNIDGEVNRLDASKPKDRMNMNVAAYALKDVVLSEGSDFPVSLSRADSDFNVKASLTNGVVDAVFDGRFNSVSLSGGDKAGGGHLKKSLYEALSDIRGFDLKVALSGTREDYKMRLSSNIDDVLKKAVGSIVKKESARLQQRLQAAITEKVNGPITKLTGDIGGLDLFDKELSSKLGDLEGLLSGGSSDSKSKSGLRGLLPF